MCHSQERLCKLYPSYPASQEAGPPVFWGNQSCDPAAWLAERQLLAGESNPGPKPTLKTLLHTLTKYTNSPVQPSQSSSLSPAHSPPNSPTSIQSPLQNTPTYHKASIQLHTLIYLKQHTGPLDVSREGGASANQVERTPGRATLTSWVVGPLHSYTQEGWVDNNNNKRAMIYSMALGPRFFKWKMLSLSGPKALPFLQLLIALLTRSVVNVCAISMDLLFVSLVTNRVSLEEVCLPSFDVLNCWLDLVASCLDDENEIPLKVIASFPASCFALPSIPLIVLHSLVASVFWSMVSTKSLHCCLLCA